MTSASAFNNYNDAFSNALVDKLIVVMQNIIDRAAHTALTSLPTSRTEAVLKSLRKIKAADYSPDIVTTVIDATDTRESERETVSGDESGLMFVEVLFSEFLRLGCACMVASTRYNKNKNRDYLAERLITTFCYSVAEFNLDISAEQIIPYTMNKESFSWELNDRIDDTGWRCALLQLVTISEDIRKTNAMVKSSDADFIQKCGKMLA